MMNHYTVVFRHKVERKLVWNQLEFDAPGLYEVSEMFFESPVVKEIYDTIDYVWFQKEVK